MTAYSLIRPSLSPMFRSPDPVSEQVSQALLGTRVAVLEREAEWARIRTPDHYHGWVRASDLVEPPVEWMQPDTLWGEIDELWANLRPASDFRLAAVAHAPMGTRLPILRESIGWMELRLPDGSALWTESRRVQPVSGDAFGVSTHRPTAAAPIIRTARRFLMVPYLWGGCSFMGLDCSGFVQLVYRLHGLQLPRDAHLQAREGAEVAGPDKADLVFFGPRGHPERITHVGMLLDRHRFIHARGGMHVTVNSIRDETYAPLYRFGRRYL